MVSGDPRSEVIINIWNGTIKFKACMYIPAEVGIGKSLLSSFLI